MRSRTMITLLRQAVRQEQFLDVVTRDEAERRFRSHLRLEPIGEEMVPLAQARGRVLARDVLAPVDVPGFDRASVDGFAVRAGDTTGATEAEPRVLLLNPEMLTPGMQPRHPVQAGTATLIATGGMVPRGADAVIMVERTDIREIASSATASSTTAADAARRFNADATSADAARPFDAGAEPADAARPFGADTAPADAARPFDPDTGAADVARPFGADMTPADATPAADTAEAAHMDLLVEIRSPVFPGQFVAAAGSDIARGETVLRHGQVLTSREIGMLAAVGLGEVAVWRRPRVAIFSTGDEIVPPGGPIHPGQVYDSNAAVLAAAVEELGCTPVLLGIVPDDADQLEAVLCRALAEGDAVLLSGGTSKGAGDLASGVIGRLRDPGVVVHGVALKPGKPLCLAVSAGKPVAILPGFPTSAIFTFHEFVAPVLGAMAGRPAARQETVLATLPTRIGSERGRTEYVLASLMRMPDGGLAAYPTAKGSGAVTAFAQADGFFAVPANTETVAAGTEVAVRLIGSGVEPADLVAIGSHCVGLDRLIGLLESQGLRVKSLNVGSSGGLAAAKRGECDLAGIHLMDPASGVYNRPYLTEGLTLLPGYGRMQGVVFRPDNPKFRDCCSVAEAMAAASADADCLMVNRNAGSGTRILIDRLLGGARPAGYMHQAKSHNAVAVAVAQGRADWGLAIDTVARQYGLGFLPLQPERYDFVVPLARAERPAVRQFARLLRSETGQQVLRDLGFDPTLE
jgi:putative molybdopterin biosynthesis protein